MVQFNGFVPASGSRFYFDLCEDSPLAPSEEVGKTLADLEPIEVVKAFARGVVSYAVQPWFGYAGVLYNFGSALCKAGLGAYAFSTNSLAMGRTPMRCAVEVIHHLAYGSCDFVTKSLPGISALIHAVVPDKIEELYALVDGILPTEESLRNMIPQRNAAPDPEGVDAFVPRAFA